MQYMELRYIAAYFWCMIQRRSVSYCRSIHTSGTKRRTNNVSFVKMKPGGECGVMDERVFALYK